MSDSVSEANGSRRAGAIAALVLAVTLIWKAFFVLPLVPSSGAIQLIMLGLLAWCSRDIFTSRGDGNSRPPYLTFGMIFLGGGGISLLLAMSSGRVSSAEDIVQSSVGFVLASAAVLLTGWIALAFGCLRHARLGGDATWKMVGMLYMVGALVLAAALGFIALGIAEVASHEAFAVAPMVGAAVGITGALLVASGLFTHAWALVARPHGISP